MCVAYVTTLTIAQIGWIGLLAAQTSIGVMFAVAGVLAIVELAGPAIAERRFGGTPWHPHHIAERYGLLTIITLGEVVLGTVAAVGAVIDAEGWTVETALVGLAGVALAFGMWWMYFVIPSAELLHHFRDRSLGWGYGHLFLFASIAATGAGLHVAALYIEHEAHIGELAVVLTTAVPVAVYVLCLYALYSLISREIDPFHIWLVAGTAVIIVAAVVMAAAGAPLAACLLVLAAAAGGHRRRLRARRAPPPRRDARPVDRFVTRAPEPGARQGRRGSEASAFRRASISSAVSPRGRAPTRSRAGRRRTPRRRCASIPTAPTASVAAEHAGGPVVALAGRPRRGGGRRR